MADGTATPATVAATAKVWDRQSEFTSEFTDEFGSGLFISAGVSITPSTVAATAAQTLGTINEHRYVHPYRVRAVAAVPLPSTPMLGSATPTVVAALAAVPRPGLGSDATTGAIPDDFDDGTVAAYWTVLDFPNEGATVTEPGGYLQIAVPGSYYAPDPSSRLFVVQSVTDADYDLSVNVNMIPHWGISYYQQAGLSFRDSTTGSTLDFYITSNYSTLRDVGFIGIRDGAYWLSQPTSQASWNDVFGAGTYPPSDVDLRVTRNSDEWQLFARYYGVTDWQYVLGGTMSMTIDEIGIGVASLGGSGWTTRFGWFGVPSGYFADGSATPATVAAAGAVPGGVLGEGKVVTATVVAAVAAVPAVLTEEITRVWPTAVRAVAAVPAFSASGTHAWDFSWAYAEETRTGGNIVAVTDPGVVGVDLVQGDQRWG